MALFDDYVHKIKTAPGFLAALDQSGGSTPQALAQYGIAQDQYSGDEEMFAMVHAMRTRIMTNDAFTGEHILGAILFADTMDRRVAQKPTARYLWEEKNIVPFLKVDQGLDERENGVALMKPMTELDTLLARAKTAGIFGTKMRSVIYEAHAEGIAANVAQQFAFGKKICAAGFVPILEPEVDIAAGNKKEIEEMLVTELIKNLDTLSEEHNVMLKITLPEEANIYAPCINHPRVLKVVALSGGYTRDEANARLAQNTGVVASFSRALSEGLRAQQSDEEFTATLHTSIDAIFTASMT